MILAEGKFNDLLGQVLGGIVCGFCREVVVMIKMLDLSLVGH